MASFRRERDSEYNKRTEWQRRAKKTKAERHRRRDQGIKSWSDLPEDIRVSITERLYVADRVRFHAVCRNWSVQSADLQSGPGPIDKLPWTMEYKWRNPKAWTKNASICKLYGPLNQNRTRSYVVVDHERMLYKEVENGRITVGRRSFVNAKVHGSWDGWILLFESLEDVLFFFNPFTKTVINIPPLRSGELELATCSSAPVSPTFFVFALCKGGIRGRCIYIYSHAKKTWERHPLMSSNDHPNLGNPIGLCYTERTGTIYCSFTSFHLIAFDIASQKQSLVVTPDPELDHHPFLTELILRYTIRSSNFLGCDGDLFLLFLSATVPRTVLRLKWYVLKLDWERKEWVQVNSLEGRAMFMGDISFCVSAGGETDIVANRIYYFHRGVPYYQTLDGYDSLDPEDGGKREEVNARIYGCCRAGRKILWLQPPK